MLCVLGSEFSVQGQFRSAPQSSWSCPRLPAQNAHACSIDADKTPGCPFFVDGQSTYKYMCVGAVGVPMAIVDAQTARDTRSGVLFASTSCLPSPIASPYVPACGGSAGGLIEKLFLHHVVDCDIGQHCHLIPCKVCGPCHVAHPGINAVTH